MNVETVAARAVRAPAEVLVVAHRVALRLGCSTALLAAPEHLEGVGALSGDLDVRLVAVPEDLEDISRRAEGHQVVARDDSDLLSALPLERTLVVLSPDALAGEPGAALGLVARRAAAVVVGASSHWAPGAPGVAELRDLATAGGLHVVHAGLLRAQAHPASRRDSPFLVAAGDVSCDRVRELMRTGPHSLALDPRVDVTARASRPARVCIASYEVVGPTKNGGIGTANTSLAQALARAGNDVTLLFTGPELTERELAAWRRHYQAEGITFDLLPFSGRGASPHVNVRRSYELYEWLARKEREQPFDVLHYPDCQGHGYFPALAKKHGLAFQQTELVAGVHSSTRWVFEANREPIRSVEALVDEHLEQESVALADVLVSPSAYLVGYLRERGWTLPERWFVQQYALPASVAGRSGPVSQDGAPSELVFFGRLEVRKGVEAFCDALDSLSAEPHGLDLQITFMGKAQHILSEPAEAYVERRAERWPWPWRIISDLTHADAIRHLSSGLCVAVIPSLVDNSPNTVTEALALGIPLVTSRTGGTGELVHTDDLERCSFDGWGGVDALQPPEQFDPTALFDSGPLAARLRAVLGEPGHPSRFAIDPVQNEQVHVGWHAGVVAAARDSEPERPWLGDGSPRRENAGSQAVPVGVCVLNRDEPDGLRHTLLALERQDHPPSDVLIVDQGSSSSASQRVIDAAQKLGLRRGWRVIRGGDAGAGRDLNDACNGLAGELVVFMRAGDCPQPDLIRGIAEVARHTKADILSFPVWNAVAGDEPGVLLPVGGPALLGLIYPAFSVGCFAARKEGLERLEGFAPDSRADDAEHELLDRALLRGLRLEVVPRPLATRVVPDSWAAIRTAGWVQAVPWSYDSEQQLRIARPFAAVLPPSLREFPSLVRGLQDSDPGGGVEFEEQARHLRLQHKRLQELESWIDHLEGELRSRGLARFLPPRLRAPAGRLRRAADRLRRRLRRRS